MAKEKKLSHGDPVRNTRTGATGTLLDAYTGGPDAPRYSVLPDGGDPPDVSVTWWADEVERT